MNIETQVFEIVKDVFDDEDLVFDNNISKENYYEWDSLAQISILSSCEKAFNIKFSMAELSELVSFTDIVNSVKNKMK